MGLGYFNKIYHSRLKSNWLTKKVKKIQNFHQLATVYYNYHSLRYCTEILLLGTKVDIPYNLCIDVRGGVIWQPHVTESHIFSWIVTWWYILVCKIVIQNNTCIVVHWIICCVFCCGRSHYRPCTSIEC